MSRCIPGLSSKCEHGDCGLRGERAARHVQPRLGISLTNTHLMQETVERIELRGRYFGLVMHGNHQSGLDLADDLDRLAGSNSAVTSDRNQQDVHILHQLDLLRVEETRQVAQMTDSYVVYCNQIRRVAHDLIG